MFYWQEKKRKKKKLYLNLKIYLKGHFFLVDRNFSLKKLVWPIVRMPRPANHSTVNILSLFSSIWSALLRGASLSKTNRILWNGDKCFLYTVGTATSQNVFIALIIYKYFLQIYLQCMCNVACVWQGIALCLCFYLEYKSCCPQSRIYANGFHHALDNGRNTSLNCCELQKIPKTRWLPHLSSEE